MPNASPWGLGCAALFLACSTPSEPISPPPSVPPEPVCLLSIDPSEMKLGYVRSGVPLSRPVTFTNLGEAPCAILGTQLYGRLASLRLELPSLPLVIAPGSSVLGMVAMIGGDQLLYNAEIELLLADGGHPRIHVLAEGGDAKIVVAPDSLSFLTTANCPPRRASFRFANEGNLSARLFSSRFVPDDGAFTLTSTLPAELVQGRPARVEVGLASASAGEHQAVLEILHERDSGEISAHPVTLSGTVEAVGLKVDRFDVGPMLDVLLVIDDSPSMIEEQALLAANLERLRAELDASGIDYQLGVTTTDVSPSGPRGAILPLANPIIFDGSSSAEWAQVTNVGTSGSPLTSGLTAATLALSSEAAAQNGALFRPGAFLRIVIITANDDHSIDFRQAELSAGAYEHYGADLGWYGLFLIAGPCSESSASAVSSAAYQLHYNFPVNLQICSPTWGETVPLVSFLPFDSTSYPLRKPADPSSIVVLVNGLQVAAGNPANPKWTYEVASQTLVFAEQWAPPYGSELIVRYVLGCPID